MIPARWWEPLPGGDVRCSLCPRACRLSEGQTGACGIRRVEKGRLEALSQGGVSSLAVDPVEKKPFFHLLPGSRALSFGTLGCTLACAFCQNAAISQPGGRTEMRLMTPEGIVRAALDNGCPSVAFTYNEPLASAEWTLDVASACRDAGLSTLAVTSGYASAAPLRELMPLLDAANVDLKAFSETFYRRWCRGRLAPVLENLQAMAAAGLWLELTTLLLPGQNDSEAEIRALAAWIRDHLGPGTPLHLTAFHPAHRMLALPPTPLQTLRQARRWALEEGLAFVYTGNLPDAEGTTTWCPRCGLGLIHRERHRATISQLAAGTCPGCGHLIPGRWA